MINDAQIADQIAIHAEQRYSGKKTDMRRAGHHAVLAEPVMLQSVFDQKALFCLCGMHAERQQAVSVGLINTRQRF